MAKAPWRIQIPDLQPGAIDAEVTIFMGEVVPVLDEFDDPILGKYRIEQHTANPVVMKLSEVANFLDLLDAVKMGKKRTAAIQAKKDANVDIIVGAIE